MTSIEVPDWVARKVLAGYLRDWDDCSESNKRDLAKIMAEAIAAALGAWVVPALGEYQRLRDGVGGCTDGGCVIRRPTGMHTNGGCKCWQDKLKAQRMMRAGQKLFDNLRQEKPE